MRLRPVLSRWLVSIGAMAFFKRFRRPPAFHPGRKVALAHLRRDRRTRTQEDIRARTRTAGINPGMAVAYVLGRYKMYVDPGDISLGVHLMMDGYWEMWLTEELAQLVQPGMVVADVGANVGYFTLLMADRVEEQGHVVAFEPNPQAADKLQRSVRANGFSDRVSVEHDPLGAISGLPVQLYFNPEEAGGAFISTDQWDGFGVRIDCLTRRMDEHPRAHEIALAKIDAEGSEERIWESMSGMLAGDVLRTVVLEWSSCRYSMPDRFLDAILGEGFSLAYIDPDEGILPIDKERLLGDSGVTEWLLLLRR